MVFGGKGNGQYLNDLWELSLEKKENVDLFGIYDLYCQASSGAFKLSITNVIVNVYDHELRRSSQTIQTITTSSYIYFNSSIMDFRSLLEDTTRGIHGVSIEEIR